MGPAQRWLQARQLLRLPLGPLCNATAAAAWVAVSWAGRQLHGTSSGTHVMTSMATFCQHAAVGFLAWLRLFCMLVVRGPACGPRGSWPSQQGVHQKVRGSTRRAAVILRQEELAAHWHLQEPEKAGCTRDLSICTSSLSAVLKG